MSDYLSGHRSAIEAAAVRGWPALETAPIDGWLWRYSSGGSTRGNSVATLSFHGGDVGRAIDAVEDLAQSRATAACFTVSDLSQPAGLDAKLAERGYAIGGHHVTMAKQVALGTAMPDGIVLCKATTPGWMDVYLAGLAIDYRAAAPALLANLPTSATYLSAVADGVTVASGLTIPDGQFASVQCMATAAQARRQGWAQRLLQAIEHVAERGGQHILYLQTSATNEGAISLYTRMGFTTAGHYHTRSKTFVVASEGA